MSLCVSVHRFLPHLGVQARQKNNESKFGYRQREGRVGRQADDLLIVDRETQVKGQTPGNKENYLNKELNYNDKGNRSRATENNELAGRGRGRGGA